MSHLICKGGATGNQDHCGAGGGRNLCRKPGEQAEITLEGIWAESIGLACDGKTELLSLHLLPSQETEMELHPSNALESDFSPFFSHLILVKML